MSMDDYNRGYQSGWSGVATGPPRSAVEMVGRWNAESDRQRMTRVHSSAPAGSDSVDVGVNGLLVLAAICGAAIGWLIQKSLVGGVIGATAAVLGSIALAWCLIWTCRVVAWVFRPIPATRVAILGAVGAVGLQWALGLMLGRIAFMSPIYVAIHGALGLLLAAGTVRVAVAPFRALARRA
ncbi:hypothetical protein [Paludisphaera sp.]|uniref:hypothetical protein n=1 Tax=Paludisphaera sp. TaxID=2017432 RepID=UPI00301DB5B3